MTHLTILCYMWNDAKVWELRKGGDRTAIQMSLLLPSIREVEIEVLCYCRCYLRVRSSKSYDQYEESVGPVINFIDVVRLALSVCRACISLGHLSLPARAALSWRPSIASSGVAQSLSSGRRRRTSAGPTQKFAEASRRARRLCSAKSGSTTRTRL